MSRGLPSPSIPFAVHGAVDEIELRSLGLSADDVTDFSASVNPFGPSPSVHEALRNVTLNRYPDRHCEALTRKVAEQHGVAIENVLVGNGASELLWLAALTILRPGDRALVLGPTYGEYVRACRIAEAEPVELRASESDRFRPDLASVAEDRASAVFLCNPNNPTGRLIPRDALADISSQRPDQTWIVDEAYQDYLASESSMICLEAPNILVVRSLTKAHALAALRVGYAIGPSGLIGAMREHQPPWSVNSMAQAAAVAALSDTAHLRATVDRLRREGGRMSDTLATGGWPILATDTPYFLVRVGDATGFRRELLGKGILVRDATSFGLPSWIRISPRRPKENDRFLAAMDDLR
ncbi:Threonine-phosphate decarboxylase [Planctomycetes bacterium Pan216]|uniref:Aminotransferase n=1 Tax=Kolteria novifilia TaxID=2527975 RepID=A0A518B8M4_9BACT|nr:Threonine-phosphate decarboxylase [Planctomycetes bacterium Pan216]